MQQTNSINLTTTPSRSKKKFTKFRDNRIKKRVHKSIKKKPFNPNESYVNKLYNSLKRRAARRQINAHSHGNHPLRRAAAANMSNSLINLEAPKTPRQLAWPEMSQYNASYTLEEGEIVSCENSDNDDEDDDCILIEPTLVNISIPDDDKPSTSFSSSALVSSTLYLKSKKPVTTTESSAAPPARFFIENGTKSKQTVSRKTRPIYETRINELPQCSQQTEMETDVICIDDASTIRKSDTITPQNLEDSVIFVSEIRPNDFIPLESKDVPNPINVPKERISRTPHHKTFVNDLFTASEHKQIKEYNKNAYNPDADDKKKQRGTKRMVLIDGSNVAFGHALCKEFSVRGLQICIEYFVKMGHEVKAVIPNFRRNMHKSTDPALIDALNSQGYIVFTPCKNLPGLNSTSYDDRFILQLACELDAAIVSNDNYRDLLHESSAFKKIIENRVIGYTWCNDIFILPKDPYGRWGPTLDSILNRV